MAKEVTKSQREQVENLVYSVLDKVDPSKTNSDYYRNIFSQMDNQEFYKFWERRLPIRFHYEIFKIEPKMADIVDAFKIVKKPLIERVNLPHIYVNPDTGKPVQSQPCMVIYIHIKRMKQMLAAKTHVSVATDKRDMKTGLLTSEDKAAKNTDREFEALAAYGLDYNIDEFSRMRADSLRAGAEADAIITDKGTLSDKDFTVAKDDDLAKNMLNVYLLAANIYSNLIDSQYMTPLTAKNKSRAVERI